MRSERDRCRDGLCIAVLAVFVLTSSALAQEEPAATTEPAAQAATQPATQPAAEPAAPAATQPAAVKALAAVAGPAQQEAKAANDPVVTVGAANTIDLSFGNSLPDVRVVLQMLSQKSGKNIIITKEVTGKVDANLHNATFKEALEAVLRATGYAYQEDGNFIFVMTQDQHKKAMDAARKLGTRTFRLAYVTAADAKTLITPAMSKDGVIATTPSAAMGIATSKTDAGGNTYATDDVLVVRDYEDNLARMDAIVRDIDVKPEQVLIETTILRATLNENEDLGIDFNTLAGVDFQNFGATTDADTNVKPDGADVTDKITPSATFRTDFKDAVPKGGFTFGFVSNNVGFFVRALESVTDTTVLANPKLLVVNKQRGEVLIGNRDGYLTTTVTETVATQTVQFLETGTRLVVRPYIGRNGFIRMELHPEDSSGSVATVGTSVLPSESTTEVTSNVLVRDGHTIVIGGLFRERTVNGRSQVPLLGNIPCVGAAFRSTNDVTVREEVIILVTPHIIRQDADEAVGEQIKDDVERYRVGQRKGLQWWGRSRLAQTHIRWARQAIAEGKIDRALCNLDMALSLEPRLIDAIRLKERLTNQAYWSDEAKSSTVKYVVEDMMMQELGLPVERILPPCKPLDPAVLPAGVQEKFGIIPAPQDPLLKQVMCGPGLFKAAPESADSINGKGSDPSPTTAPAVQPTPE